MPTLEGYRFGHLIVDGKEQTRDVIVLPERMITNWWRIEGHRLVLEDLDDVRQDLPAHLVIGTGAHGQCAPIPRRLRSFGAEVSTSRPYRQRLPCAATRSSIRTVRPRLCT
ncbi:MAG: hypothetical protein K0S98_1530 [Propionibacteriaceae bacterium]|nr:hypothetical protein [Propionibacteriaceae bacterium]